MQSAAKREVLLERRNFTPEQSSLWDKLTLAQKFAVSHLSQFGYELAFIRNGKMGNMAVMLCAGKAATICDDGEINTSPDITIRP